MCQTAYKSTTPILIAECRALAGLDRDFDKAAMTCPRCGVKSLARDMKRACPEAVPCFAGRELKSLVKRLGITITPGCKCTEHAFEMDRRGREWCRENISAVAGWLKEETDRRKDKHAEQQLAYVANPRGQARPEALRLPFSETAARQLVKLAIRRAERAAGE